ncbi:hypothetical protein TWF718_000398 [Orbilia javanica]|uniref:Uncharacterized protein n=1 Tax=Orbilia javanica TaxID=47235 RepID=A0AAN8RGD7_9PEZI
MFTVNLKRAIAVNPAISLLWPCFKTPGKYLTKAASKCYSKSAGPLPKPYKMISLDGITGDNCQYNVTDYKVIINRLAKKGVIVLPRACASSDSSALAYQVLRQSYQRLYVVAMKAQSLEVRARKLQGSNETWRATLQKSSHDLMLACEAHRQGYSFLSHDAKFGKQLEIALTKMGITTYLIPNSWTDYKEELKSQT